jgi:hypothetical protein
LPTLVHRGLEAAYSQSIETVFIIAAPIAFVAFMSSWLIPQLELRRAIGKDQPKEEDLVGADASGQGALS